MKHSQLRQGLQIISTLKEENMFINYGPRRNVAIGLWMSGNSAIDRSGELIQKLNWRNFSLLAEMATSGAYENLTSSVRGGINLLYHKAFSVLPWEIGFFFLYSPFSVPYHLTPNISHFFSILVSSSKFLCFLSAYSVLGPMPGSSIGRIGGMRLPAGVWYKVELAREPFFEEFEIQQDRQNFDRTECKMLEQKCKHCAMGLQGEKNLFSYLEIKEVFTKERTLE